MRDRHVLITGGSSGIGLALAHRLVAEGARVSLVARDPLKLSAVFASLHSTHPAASKVFTAPADVSIQSQVIAAIRSAEAVHGPVDVLITSAGVAIPGYFANLTADVFERTMAVNYFGTLYAIQAVVPAMVARRSGNIVIISSGAGLVGLFGYTAYAPSKFALRGLAESLRAELKPAGVGVTIVYPPDTDTPQLADENRTKPAETRALTAAAGLWTADAVARATLAGVSQGRFSVTPGIQLTALSWLHSLIAPLLRWSFDRTAKKAGK
jgi:3-dehydrosphinganine reductase